VEIMIVVAIIALLASIAIPNLLRARITANESAAQATLRTISVAIETYASANGGTYPTAETDLTGVTPPYLNKAYNEVTESGYKYVYTTLATTNYTVTARPTSCTMSGTKSFTVSTGGVLSTDASCTAAS